MKFFIIVALIFTSCATKSSTPSCNIEFAETYLQKCMGDCGDADWCASTCMSAVKRNYCK